MDRPYSFELAQPPRRVPWTVRSQLLFGGFANQFGWAFLGFGLVFLWIFGLNTDFTGPLFLLLDVETTGGTVVEVQETGSSENDTPIYANTYTYRVERLEAEYRGVSYSPGRQFEPGWSVTVEYLRDSPEISRLQGMRRAAFPPWVLCIVLPFPLVGLGFVAFGFRNGLKANRLLAGGRIGVGKLVSKTATGASVNEQPVYKLEFEFLADDGGLYKVTSNTHRPYALEDEPEERLLYNPYSPSYAVMLDNLPGSPDIDEFGQIQAADWASSLLPLVLPGLALLINGVAFLWVVF